MKYAIQQSVFRSTDRVETAPFAQITVTESLSGDAASLWSDVNGITAITGNVFVADENGFFRFYVTAGQYDLEIQSDGITSNINDGCRAIIRAIVIRAALSGRHDSRGTPGICRPLD